ncbi:hypothetical protein EG68_06760 [Paragonimus skrjabini miyazakii]|uniref:Sodium-dependent multivitamin transporter n=1 Tax=Paragonimus skrjabini miyazakii TaxID=59628 RepID=A0A8S9YRX9_9TREM|nr:hypothetical protein EG68_06760 [Paragonimus skrjabini miyazakii]
MASFLSAVSLLGTAAEAYLSGMQFCVMIVAYLIAFPVASEVYMPVFYKLRLASAHEVGNRKQPQLTTGWLLTFSTRTGSQSTEYNKYHSTLQALSLLVPFKLLEATAILLNIPTNAIFLLVQLTAGLVTFAYFEGCDLVKSGLIKKSDQILPYVVMVLFNGIPVVRGLFLSIIFAAALSTVSSGVNSLANVVLEDIIRPSHLFLRQKDLSVKCMTIMAFVLSALIGLSTIGLAFLIPIMVPRILDFSFTLFGALGGPILAVFTLGMIVPCVNNKGGIAGLLASIIVGLWLSIGAILNPSPSSSLPLSNISCAVGNASKNLATSVNQLSWSIYSISYLYYTPICLLVALIVSIPVSAISGFNTTFPVKKMYQLFPVGFVSHDALSSTTVLHGFALDTKRSDVQLNRLEKAT